jgi:hypothetical protein
MVFLAAMIALLLTFNNRPIFNWNGVTLNTIVSILSTASKSSLLYLVAEAIGQWRWILYAQASRPLLYIEWLDSASRGPWGSTLLLWAGRNM